MPRMRVPERKAGILMATLRLGKRLLVLPPLKFSSRRATMALLAVLMALAVVAADTRPASAKYLRYWRGIYPYGRYSWGRTNYGYRNRGYGYGMPGTALSSNAYGMASMVAASGYAQLSNSQAVQNNLQARSTDAQNRLAWTSEYYQLRQAHRAYENNHARLSQEDAVRIAQAGHVRRLDATQLDPATGTIHWPALLDDARYVTVRNDIEHLYKSRAAAAGKIDAESYLAINKSCENLLQQLKQHIDEYNPNDYLQARHFVEGLRNPEHDRAP